MPVIPQFPGGSGNGEAVGGGASPISVLRKVITVGDGSGSTYTTAELFSGVTLWTPAVGDILLHVFFQLDTVFDGTNPYADISTFINDTSGSMGVGGMLSFYSGYPYQLNISPTLEQTGGEGFGNATDSIPNDFLSGIMYDGNSKGIFPIANDTNPLLVKAFTNTGPGTSEALDSTEGQFTVTLVIAPVSAATVV